MTHSWIPALKRAEGLWIWCFFTLLALVTYSEMLRFLSFSPEDAYFYGINYGKSALDVLREYRPVPLAAGWYRPTSFFTTYWILTSLWQWHDLFYFKLANLLLLSTLATLVYRAGTLLFPGSRLGPFLGACYFIYLPLLFIPLFDVTAFDFLQQSLILASIIAFLRYLNQPARGRLLASFAFFLLALTAKETAVALPLLLVWLFFVYAPPAGSAGRRIVRSVGVTWPFVVADAAYLFVRLRHTQAVATGPYRTVANTEIITRNLLHSRAWLLRFFPPDDDMMVYFATPWSNGWAVFLVAALAVAIVVLAMVRPGGMRRPVLALLGWILCFAPIPIFSGGYPWHFATSAAGFALLWGGCVGQGLFRFVRPLRPAVAVGLVAFVVVGHAFATREFSRMIYTPGSQRFEMYSMLRSYLYGPRPVADSAVRQETHFLIKNDVGLIMWFYGVGRLFDYIYLKGGLRQSLLDTSQPKELEEWLANPFGVCVNWDKGARVWRDVTSECRVIVSKRLAGEIGPARKAGPTP